MRQGFAAVKRSSYCEIKHVGTYAAVGGRDNSYKVYDVEIGNEPRIA